LIVRYSLKAKKAISFLFEKESFGDLSNDFFGMGKDISQEFLIK
jgi:hypothetical protein